MSDTAAALTTTNIPQIAGVEQCGIFAAMDNDGAQELPQPPSCTINNKLNHSLRHDINKYAEPMDVNDLPLSNNSNAFSTLWLRTGDFHIGLEIAYIEPEYLHNLYKIFIQKTFENKDVNFGIDDHQFTINFPYQHCDFELLPDYKEYSTYWCASGESFTTFVGKPMSTEKIFRLFSMIQASLEETRFLCFGVNNLIFHTFCIKFPHIAIGYEDRSELLSTNTTSHYESSDTCNDRTYLMAVSQFWIKAGDFHIVLKIFYTEFECLHNFYKKFIQKNVQTKDINFGIDNHQFKTSIPYQHYYHYGLFPEHTEYSNYWFLSGDLLTTFVGEHMSTKKIERLFAFIKASVEESSVLHFGVDSLEYSHMPDFWS